MFKVNHKGQRGRFGDSGFPYKTPFSQKLYKAASKQDQKHYRKTTLDSIGAAIVSHCKKRQ